MLKSGGIEMTDYDLNKHLNLILKNEGREDKIK